MVIFFIMNYGIFFIVYYVIKLNKYMFESNIEKEKVVLKMGKLNL